LSSDQESIILRHYEELAQVFPGLLLCQDYPGRWVIRGTLSFSARYQDITIDDVFSILLSLPSDYPNSPPTVQETGGRIPATFHQFNDRTFCLGAPVEVKSRFKKDQRLLNFVQTLVVEYLYNYVHYEKHGTLPFGELAHGCKGIREYYQKLFATDDVNTILALLKVLYEKKYRGHYQCPCGSGNILRKCHGPVLLMLLDCQSSKLFLNDIRNVLYSIEQEEIQRLNWNLVPEILRLEINDMARDRAKQEKCV